MMDSLNDCSYWRCFLRTSTNLPQRINLIHVSTFVAFSVPYRFQPYQPYQFQYIKRRFLRDGYRINKQAPKLPMVLEPNIKIINPIYRQMNVKEVY
jgi:hypothetical protein